MEVKYGRQNGGYTFFGEYLCDQIIPEDHFIRTLNELIDWEPFTEKLILCTGHLRRGV